MTRMTRFAVTFVVTAGGLLAARAASAQDAGSNAHLRQPAQPRLSRRLERVRADGAAFAVKLAAETTPTTIVYL